MPLRIVHQSAARRDLLNIRDYGIENWGEESADHYLRHIGDRLLLLLDHPKIAPEYVGRSGAFRKLKAGEHLVFYRVEGDVIRVFRVVHSAADVDSLL